MLLMLHTSAISSQPHAITTTYCRHSELPGVPQYWLHFVFCHFLGFWSTYRRTFDLFSTALEICYILATKILKIDLEIAEIIKVKVGTRHLEIDNFAIAHSQKNNFGVAGANFDSNFSYF